MTDMREAVARAIVTKYKEYWPGSWPAKPEALGLVGLADAALSLMQPEINRRVAEERAKLLERFDEDALEEIISDSLEMDWRPRDAARAIIAQFEKENSDG